MSVRVSRSGDSELVTVAVNRGVALVTWNRPERHNAWSVALESAYFDALRRAELDPEVRAIVVTGAGASFCPGLDRDTLSGVASGSVDTRPQDRLPMTFATGIGKPIVAAINGACAGVGLIQALCCDVRFAAPGVKFTTAFARRGLMAEHGLTWLLPRVVGWGNAADLLLSARVVLSEEAAALGLVNRVVAADQLVATAVDYAADLAEHCSPIAMATIKEQLFASTAQSLDESRRHAIALWLERLKPHTDFAEGIAGLVERRSPNFAPLAVADGAPASTAEPVSP